MLTGIAIVDVDPVITAREHQALGVFINDLQLKDFVVVFGFPLLYDCVQIRNQNLVNRIHTIHIGMLDSLSEGNLYVLYVALKQLRFLRLLAIPEFC